MLELYQKKSFGLVSGLRQSSLRIIAGKARTQSPTHKNVDSFGAIEGISQTEVQWKGLALGLEDRPSWSAILPDEVKILASYCR